jgi:hypothetical protein
VREASVRIAHPGPVEGAAALGRVESRARSEARSILGREAMHRMIAVAATLVLSSTMAACTSMSDAGMSDRSMSDESMHAAMMAPPGGNYEKVSELVALPDFIPGLGTLYVQPGTIPPGPFLAYDKTGKLVSTIYMVPLADMEAQKKFDELAVGDHTVQSTDMYYNAGHPGVPQPHYHIVLWHVPEDEAMLQ